MVVATIKCESFVFVLGIHSSLANILLRKRAGCFALFVLWLSVFFFLLMMPWVDLQSVILEFSGHIHLVNR